MFKLINGWTKARMIEQISTQMQDHPSMNVVGSASNCLYRGPNGNKCAIGAFIPDFLYKKEMEGRNVDSLACDFPEIRKHLPLNDVGLSVLQSIHDRTAPDEDPRPALIDWIQEHVEEDPTPALRWS